MTNFPWPKPQYGIIGHRGAANVAPENTIPGLLAAHRHGLNWVEIDIQLTSDKHWVLFHDDKLERTTTGLKPGQEQSTIGTSLLEDLQLLDAGSWFAPEFENTRIPSLKEYCAMAEQLGMFINIEIKIDNFDQAYVDELILFLKEFQLSYPPLLSSFCHPILIALAERLPDHHLGFLFETASIEEANAILANPKHFFHCSKESFPIELVKKLSDPSRALIYTVNAHEDIQDYLAQGIFGVFSDHPNVW